MPGVTVPMRGPEPRRTPETTNGGRRNAASCLDAEGGGRTHTPRGAPDFESGASANSATSARLVPIVALASTGDPAAGAAPGCFSLVNGRYLRARRGPRRAQVRLR